MHFVIAFTKIALEESNGITSIIFGDKYSTYYYYWAMYIIFEHGTRGMEGGNIIIRNIITFLLLLFSLRYYFFLLKYEKLLMRTALYTEGIELHNSKYMCIDMYI